MDYTLVFMMQPLKMCVLDTIKPSFLLRIISYETKNYLTATFYTQTNPH